MLMTLNRNFVLATTKGHMIRFAKGEPVNIPTVCIPDAVAVGANPVDGEQVDLSAPAVADSNGPVDVAVRDNEIRAAIEKMAERNKRTDFTAAGLPATDVLTRELGYTVTASERNRIWQARNDELAAA